MSRVLYFAYGSNLDVAQMGRRCPGARALHRARLPHHRLDFTWLSSHWGGGAADVLPWSGETVWGVVYDLELRELAQLDPYEIGYERVLLAVADDAGRTHEVQSYTVRRKGSFLPTRAYLEKLLACGERWGFPQDYLERLRGVPVWGSARGPSR